MTDHTEMQISDDVMEAARKVVAEYLNRDGLTKSSREVMKGERYWYREIQIAARAIFAERERCARIADDYKKQLEGEANEWRADRMPMAAGQADAQAKASSNIAAKIRYVDK